MSKFTFTVSPDTFAVNAYVEGQEAPFIYQPEQASGEAWESEEQATAWIESVIADLEAPPTIVGEAAPVDSLSAA